MSKAKEKYFQMRQQIIDLWDERNTLINYKLDNEDLPNRILKLINREIEDLANKAESLTSEATCIYNDPETWQPAHRPEPTPVIDESDLAPVMTFSGGEAVELHPYRHNILEDTSAADKMLANERLLDHMDGGDDN